MTQRIIKFRIWNGSDMIYLAEPRFEVNRVIMESPVSVVAPPPEIIYMQFTGLSDKNSKEIYEGDIVNLVNNVFYSDQDSAHMAGVKLVGWDDKEAKLGMSNIDKLDPYFHYNFGWGGNETVEVIGNIFENPDLLTPKK